MADAPLIALVCELSTNRGSLIDTINPSCRLSRGMPTPSSLLAGDVTLIAPKVRIVKRGSKARKNNVGTIFHRLPRVRVLPFFVFFLFFFSLFRCFVRRMKICRAKKKMGGKRMCARFDTFLPRVTTHGARIAYHITYYHLIMKICDDCNVPLARITRIVAHQRD